MVEVGLTEQGTFEFIINHGQAITGLLALGFTFALIIMVMTAGVRAGWKLWPWVFLVGMVAYIIT